jgi:predicted  nucleic acid-binding Zn-ribbon protein
MRNALRPPALLAVLLLAASLLAAGCGDTDEKNDYVDEVNELQTDLVDQVTQATTSANPTTQKQAADYAGAIADIFSKSADDFAAVDPPEDVADLHSQLVDELRSIADDTKKAENTLRTGSHQEAQQALTDLQTAATDAQNALNSLIDEINADLHD